MLLSWMVKLAVTFTVLGILGFDGIAVLATKMQTADAAASAARVASDVYAQQHSSQAAYDAAVAQSKSSDVLDPNEFAVARDGGVTLRVQRTAQTIVLHRWATSARWAEVSAEGTAKAVP